MLYPVTKFAASSLLRCQQGCATQKKTLARVSRALEASLEVQHQLLVVSAVHRFTSQPLCCAFCILQTRRQNMKLRGRRLKRLTSATCRSQEQGLGIGVFLPPGHASAPLVTPTCISHRVMVLEVSEMSVSTATKPGPGTLYVVLHVSLQTADCSIYNNTLRTLHFELNLNLSFLKNITEYKEQRRFLAY